MKLRDSLRLAGRSLTGHRLRSTLTVVGIVIGIATVVIFASFGTSVQTDVVGEFEDTAASEIFVVTGDVAIGDEAFEDGDSSPFNPNQLEAFALPAVTTHDLGQLEQIEGVESVIPRGSVEATALRHDNDTVVLDSMTATTPAAFSEDDFVSGESFSDGAAGEIVLSETAAESLTENVTAGDTVEIEHHDEVEEFNVTGVASGARGGFGGFGGFAPTVYVSSDPYYTEFGDTAESPSQGVEQTAYRQATVIAPPDRVVETQSEIEQYFEQDSDAIRILDDVGLTVQSTADLVEGVESVLGDVIALVSGIGVLALLVGAFGIANIMLVSVTERTKEIGIMKANGARNREVMGLFLGEAVMLGLAGAAVGIPVGLGVGYGATVYAEVGFTIPFGWILVAAGMGIGTGIVAGLYPAWRAARVDPIDALRYE